MRLIFFIFAIYKTTEDESNSNVDSCKPFKKRKNNEWEFSIEQECSRSLENPSDQKIQDDLSEKESNNKRSKGLSDHLDFINTETGQNKNNSSSIRMFSREIEKTNCVNDGICSMCRSSESLKDKKSDIDTIKSFTVLNTIDESSKTKKTQQPVSEFQSIRNPDSNHKNNQNKKEYHNLNFQNKDDESLFNHQAPKSNCFIPLTSDLSKIQNINILPHQGNPSHRIFTSSTFKDISSINQVLAKQERTSNLIGKNKISTRKVVFKDEPTKIKSNLSTQDMIINSNSEITTGKNTIDNKNENKNDFINNTKSMEMCFPNNTICRNPEQHIKSFSRPKTESMIYEDGICEYFDEDKIINNFKNNTASMETSFPKTTNLPNPEQHIKSFSRPKNQIMIYEDTICPVYCSENEHKLAKNDPILTSFDKRSPVENLPKDMTISESGTIGSITQTKTEDEKSKINDDTRDLETQVDNSNQKDESSIKQVPTIQKISRRDIVFKNKKYIADDFKIPGIVKGPMKRIDQNKSSIMLSPYLSNKNEASKTDVKCSNTLHSGSGLDKDCDLHQKPAGKPDMINKQEPILYRLLNSPDISVKKVIGQKNKIQQNSFLPFDKKQYLIQMYEMIYILFNEKYFKPDIIDSMYRFMNSKDQIKNPTCILGYCDMLIKEIDDANNDFLTEIRLLKIPLVFDNFESCSSENQYKCLALLEMISYFYKVGVLPNIEYFKKYNITEEKEKLNDQYSASISEFKNNIKYFIAKINSILMNQTMI